jgi:hypothetical protein
MKRLKQQTEEEKLQNHISVMTVKQMTRPNSEEGIKVNAMNVSLRQRRPKQFNFPKENLLYLQEKYYVNIVKIQTLVVCARCEEIEMQTYICKACGLECLRSCFTEEELAKPDYDKTCNDCDPEAFKSSQRKPWKCLGCGESSGANFYPGFRSKCKVCTREERRQKYEMRERMLKPFLCTDCGTEIPTDFYPGHKTRCKRCL